MDSEALDERWDIDFDVSKSIRYHAYRRRFWDRVDATSKVITVVAGTAVLVSIVGDKGFWATVSALIVAIASALDLVVGFSAKARTYDGLYRAFSRLAMDIAENMRPTEADIASWRRRRLEIEMEEPSTIDLLERLAAGQEAASRGCELRPAWRLNWFQRLVAPISFLPSTYGYLAPEKAKS